MAAVIVCLVRFVFVVQPCMWLGVFKSRIKKDENLIFDSCFLMIMNETNPDLQKNANDSFWTFKLSDSLLVAIIPVIVYLLVFVTEAGYLSVFLLPWQFISFDIAEIFVATSLLFAVAFLVFVFVELVSSFLHKLKLPPIIIHKIKSYAPFFLLVLVMVLISTSRLVAWLSWGIGLLYLIIEDFVFPIFTQGHIKSYLAKLARADEMRERKRKESNSFLINIIRVVGANRAKAIFYFILVLYVAYQVGQSNALNKSIFYVVNANPEMVVLYITRDQAIVAPYSNGTLKPEFSIVEFKSNANYTFQVKKIGPLQLESDFINIP